MAGPGAPIVKAPPARSWLWSASLGVAEITPKEYVEDVRLHGIMIGWLRDDAIYINICIYTH